MAKQWKYKEKRGIRKNLEVKNLQGPVIPWTCGLKKKRRLAVNFLLSCPDVWVKDKNTWEEAEVARRWFGAGATVQFQPRSEGCFSQFPSLLLACIFCCLLEFLKTYFVLCVWVLACMYMSLLGLKLQDLYNIFQPHSSLSQLLQAPRPSPTLCALSLFFKPLSTIYIPHILLGVRSCTILLGIQLTSGEGTPLKKTDHPFLAANNWQCLLTRGGTLCTPHLCAGLWLGLVWACTGLAYAATTIMGSYV